MAGVSVVRATRPLKDRSRVTEAVAEGATETLVTIFWHPEGKSEEEAEDAEPEVKPGSAVPSPLETLSQK